ncbi:Protein of uncharacterised function (DUF1315) [Pseudomonas aeruginosa]|nr:Protein of uncharacterised function (DUF1315) [Pseudomonas aeruginosa]
MCAAGPGPVEWPVRLFTGAGHVVLQPSDREHHSRDLPEPQGWPSRSAKWPDGRKLTQEQKELCLQAVIAWELQNLPEEERTGYMGPQHCSSHSDEPIPNILFKSDSVH